MTQEEFEDAVAAALESLPDDVADLIENVDILVEDFPSRRQMRENGIRNRYGLLGLYEGVPLPDRTYGYGNAAPSSTRSATTSASATSGSTTTASSLHPRPLSPSGGDMREGARREARERPQGAAPSHHPPPPSFGGRRSDPATPHLT